MPLHRAGERIKGGYSLSRREYPPFEPPRERFALQASSLKSCGACRIECLLFLLLYDLTFFYLRCRFACVSEVLRNFRLLWILSILLLPAKAALLCSPRMRTIGRRRLGCTPTRSAERQRIIEVEANHIAKAMAASVSNAATQVLPFRRHKSRSSPKLPIKALSLGGCKGGYSLSSERE